jgi:regulator of sigma E protease
MEPVRMVGGLIGMVIRPSTAAENVAGPTAMAKVTSAAVKEGPYYVVWLAAVLSISLGVMNLLPIVPLDGGQMVVAFVELLRGGRRLSIVVQNRLANAGLALLALMMLAVFAVDLGRSAEANQKAAEDTAPPVQSGPQ